MTRDTVRTDWRAGSSETTILPLVDEEARVDKRPRVSGKVRIQTFVDSFEEKVAADLDSEAVEVTRVPVDRVVTEAPAIRTEDGVTIVPILEEVLFVEKRLLLKEELHIRRRVTTEAVEIPVTLRKERAQIDREPPAET